MLCPRIFRGIALDPCPTLMYPLFLRFYFGFQHGSFNKVINLAKKKKRKECLALFTLLYGIAPLFFTKYISGGIGSLDFNPI
jgi:hypothetical protein